MTEMLGHLGRTGRAVEPDDVDLERVDGAQGRRDLGPGQHAPGELDRDLRLERHLPADGGHRPPGADDRGLETEQVELGLDQHQIDAAFEQAPALDLVRVAEVGEADLAEGGELRAGPDRSGDEAVVAARHLTGDLRGLEVDLVRLVGDAVLGERDGEGAERGRLDDVDTDLEERVVHLRDEIGPCEHEHLVAALELGATEVVTREALLLHVRAEGAVVDRRLAASIASR